MMDMIKLFRSNKKRNIEDVAKVVTLSFVDEIKDSPYFQEKKAAEDSKKYERLNSENVKVTRNKYQTQVDTHGSIHLMGI